MKQAWILIFCMTLSAACRPQSEESARQIRLLDKGWLFINQDVPGGEDPDIGTEGWESVTVPHDWAISGAFDPLNDAYESRRRPGSQVNPPLITGSTGALPHVGTGWYRMDLEIAPTDEGKRILVEFDGAMSHARVYLNGSYVGEWPYGYASFGFDLTPLVNFGGRNLLAVRLENPPNASRWYPGAGIYRHVRLITTGPVHMKQWGTYVTTPDIAEGRGTVHLEHRIMNSSGNSREITLETRILSSNGTEMARIAKDAVIGEETRVDQTLEVSQPELWSVENPVLYRAETRILERGKELDRTSATFGFRFLEFTSDSGFFLNGQRVRLNGVCLHHDLGPLGAAVNRSSLRHRMKLLQEMGCNSIRTSHNPPAPELLDLADEMGFLVIDEAFDEWKYPKVRNGYHLLWDEWAEKDMAAFIQRDRNHPSVIMWSIGNEIQEQGIEGGAEFARILTEICSREDPTRPTTAGFNQWENAIRNGFAELVDVAGWNYKPQYYGAIHRDHPDWKMYASETASTVSSRGEYFFPAVERIHYTREPYHCNSFDMEFPYWATSPDQEFAAQDSFPFMAGEYVWTGFDYLGEPTPYSVQWPSRSSYFGIIDLCGIPKDRYYLYQSKWTDREVLHLLPHWNWEPGQMVSVHCYTGFDRGELFLNGKSLGIREKDPAKRYTTYRLVWDDIPFEEGELKVVALDLEGNPLKETAVRTAGPPAKIRLEADRMEMTADGKELVFVTVSITDASGTVCPRASNMVEFSVVGNGSLRAVGNGDPTSLESFVQPYRRAFNGKCMAILQSDGTAGRVTLTATSDGLGSPQVTIRTVADP